MKFGTGFSWGDGSAKAKANRIKRASETQPVPLTGYVHDRCVLIGECPHCSPASPDWCNTEGACISYDFSAQAGTGWHEYIVAFKKQNGASGTDGEFRLYVDGQVIGTREGFHWHDEDIAVAEAWGAWMTSPYWQMNGSASDGGSVWFDDYSLDDEWNSTEFADPGGQAIVPELRVRSGCDQQQHSLRAYTLMGRQMKHLSGSAWTPRVLPAVSRR
jgi:hypothetical protein